MKTLKLDLDGKNGINVFLNRIWLVKWLGLAVVKVKVYGTVNGYHVRLYCDNDIQPFQAVLIQSILGDDYKRTACNMLKLERGSKKQWNPLFKKKWDTNKLGQTIEVSRENLRQGTQRQDFPSDKAGRVSICPSLR